MDIQIFQDWKTASRVAADIVHTVVQEKPTASICFATGNTPKQLYNELVQDIRDGRLSLSSIRAFTLDETGMQTPSGKPAFLQVMYENLYTAANLSAIQIDSLNPYAEDIERECLRYQKAIQAAGPLDLVILGIGINGHLAYNEPGSSLQSRTRKVILESGTAAITSSYFGTKVTTNWGLTIGIADILEARRLLVLANGSNKARVVQSALEGPVTEAVPASFIQLHPNVTVLLDLEASRELKGLHSTIGK
jgi:glucosamine-6-phosphate deaminase